MERTTALRSTTGAVLAVRQARPGNGSEKEAIPTVRGRGSGD